MYQCKCSAFLEGAIFGRTIIADSENTPSESLNSSNVKKKKRGEEELSIHTPISLKQKGLAKKVSPLSLRNLTFSGHTFRVFSAKREKKGRLQ